MPLLQVKTSIEIDRTAAEALLCDLSAQLAQQLGKSEAYVMTAFEGNVLMTFGGSSEMPSCYVEVKSLGGLSTEKNKDISRALCDCITSHTDIAGDRIYIEFADVARPMWGRDGSTFG